MKLRDQIDAYVRSTLGLTEPVWCKQGHSTIAELVDGLAILLAPYEKEHSALHAYFVGELLLVDAGDQFKLRNELLSAHDEVALSLSAVGGGE